MSDELTPTAERIVADLDEVRRIDSRQPILNTAIVVALAVVFAALGLLAVRSETRSAALEEIGAQRDRDIAAIQDELKGVCRAVPAAELAPSEQDACSRAERGDLPVVRDGDDGEPGRPPTAEEIESAVWRYFADHPLPEGKEPSIAQVSAAVADYLVANPPEPGRAPTVEEIAAAVATYFARNPVRDGEPGRPPTAEEIAAAVQSYCTPPGLPSPCRGADGVPGPACPEGFELREAVVTAADGSTYRGRVCVDPSSSSAPTTSDTPPALLPIPRR